jgi:hypothetical protein
MFDSREVRKPTAFGELGTNPSDFAIVNEFFPGEAPHEWDGLNTLPLGVGVLWVDVDLSRAPLRSLQLLLSSLCPGIPLERITDFFMVELESRAEELFPAETPDVSVVRSFDWLVTCWHGDGDHEEAHRAVEERWREIGPAGAMTARDLAAIFLDEISDQRGSICQVA